MLVLADEGAGAGAAEPVAAAAVAAPLIVVHVSGITGPRLCGTSRDVGFCRKLVVHGRIFRYPCGTPTERARSR